MKKLLLIALVVVFTAAGTVSEGLAQQKTPQYGGILREIWATGPRVLSYLPEMGPGDEQSILPAAEKLMDYNAEKQLVPFLAESVTVAKDGKSITFKLRKGIKFTDGSDLNAEAVVWNYQLNIDAKRLQYRDKITKIEIIDPYTIKFHITDYTNMLLHSYGWVPLFSKAAWDKAGDGNAEKSKEWARANIVATGPFKLAEYKRDNYLRWVKNENYWQKGKPYLDGITIRYIPDSVTASAMMQAKEADFWLQPPVKDQADLEKKGFLRQSGFGLPRMIYLNTKDPDSKFQNLKLREAVEYALDKPAIAKALGFGYYTPLTMVAPPGEWGYDPEYKGRPYDPAKAKQLIAEAGFPNGVKIKMTAMTGGTWPDEVAAIKRYLDDVGMTVDPDMADPGRFFNMLWLQGWQDAALFLSGLDPNYLITFHRTFGPQPMANYASFKRPPDLMTLAEKSLHLKTEAEQRAITKQLVRLMADEALVIPFYLVPNTYIMPPYVHTTFFKECMVTRRTFDEWMDKH
ncbi:MAG: ABC transporter substrate-binding protein [Syntrophorhabdales bacterium]|jgi:ABC-type transport system substrate-binding protein